MWFVFCDCIPTFLLFWINTLLNYDMKSWLMSQDFCFRFFLQVGLLHQQLLQTFKVLNRNRRHSTTSWIKQFVQEHSTLNKTEQTNYPIIRPSRTPNKNLASIPMTHPKGTNHWCTFNYVAYRGPVWILNPGWLIVIDSLSLFSLLNLQIPWGLKPHLSYQTRPFKHT